MDSYSIMNLEIEHERIHNIVFEIGFKYINDSSLRLKYMDGEEEIASSVIDEYKSGHIDFGRAMDKLRKHYEILQQCQISLHMGSIQLYVIAEREEDRYSLATWSLKTIGFISGSMQFIGGVGVCVSGLRAACAKYGVPMIVNGGENAWENSYYLVFRENTERTPIRDAYRYVAQLLGGNEKDGDIAFSAVDIGLSFHAMSNLALKSDSWRLFRYIRADFIRGWESMGMYGVGAELTGDAASGYSLYQLIQGEDTSWDDLHE